MPEETLVDRLHGARRREKAMTLFYRALAAAAEDLGRPADSERLNGLHADEQHHLSRLTARLLEFGESLGDFRDLPRPEIDAESWEADAREREADEIAFYQAWLDEGVGDPETEAILREILESEVHHHRNLGGKWMPAT